MNENRFFLWTKISIKIKTRDKKKFTKKFRERGGEGNFPRGNFPWEQFSGGHFSGGIFPRADWPKSHLSIHNEWGSLLNQNAMNLA